MVWDHIVECIWVLALEMDSRLMEYMLWRLGKKSHVRLFPGDLVVRILGFHCCGLSSVLVWGAEILCRMAKNPPKTKKAV